MAAEGIQGLLQGLERPAQGLQRRIEGVNGPRKAFNASFKAFNDPLKTSNVPFKALKVAFKAPNVTLKTGKASFPASCTMGATGPQALGQALHGHCGQPERVLDWPGVHAARSILEDVSFKGYWFDRTQEYAARNGRGLS